MRSTTEVFEDHLYKRLNGQTEEDITQNYSPEVVLLSGTGGFNGLDGVRQSANELANYLGDAQFEYRLTLIEGDYAFLEWTAVSNSKKVCDGADSFVIKNGKIIFQSVHYSVVEAN